MGSLIKVLLVGSDGTLGTSLRHVSHAGFDIVPWTMKNCDLTDLASIGPKLSVESPAIIINASAFTDVDGAELNEQTATLINGDAVGQMASYCMAHGILLVHFSTDYVFSGDHAQAYAEQDVPDPINAYGRSKLKGEQLIKESGCQFICIRTSRLFGRASSTQGKKNFIEKMLELAHRTSTISVVDDERTSPTYADDLAVTTFDLIRSDARGIFHRTNDGECTWYEFAREIFSISKLPVTLVPVAGASFPRPAKRPAHSTLVSTKLSPLRNWKEPLREYLFTNTTTV